MPIWMPYDEMEDGSFAPSTEHFDFNLTTGEETEEFALLLPAIQAAREAARKAAGNGIDSIVVDHDEADADHFDGRLLTGQDLADDQHY